MNIPVSQSRGFSPLSQRSPIQGPKGTSSAQTPSRTTSGNSLSSRPPRETSSINFSNARSTPPIVDETSKQETTPTPSRGASRVAPDALQQSLTAHPNVTSSNGGQTLMMLDSSYSAEDKHAIQAKTNNTVRLTAMEKMLRNLNSGSQKNAGPQPSGGPRQPTQVDKNVQSILLS